MKKIVSLKFSEKEVKLKNNFNIYYLFYLIKSLLFYIPIFVIYLTDVLQNSFEVGIVLTVKSISVFLLEVPMGYIADKCGRKKSIIYSSLINIISLLFLIISPNFYTVILSELFFSVSETLFSGADIALIYDNFKFEKRENLFEEFQRNASLLGSITLALSFFIGSYIYFYNKKLVFILSIISSLILLIVLKKIKEHPYTEEFNQSCFSIKKDLIKINKESFILKNMIVYSSIVTSIFMAIYFYIFPIVLDSLKIKDNNMIYGATYALGVLLIGIGGKYQKYVKNEEKFLYFAGIYLVPIMIFISFFKNRVCLILLILLMRMLWGVYSTNNNIIINQKLIDSSLRATVFSIKNAILNSFLGVFFLGMGYLGKIEISIFVYIKIYAILIVILYFSNKIIKRIYRENKTD